MESDAFVFQEAEERNMRKVRRFFPGRGKEKWGN